MGYLHLYAHSSIYLLHKALCDKKKNPDVLIHIIFVTVQSLTQMFRGSAFSLYYCYY